ncbi:hypothetical protein SASPL_148342 [Salvia splendens]|uniref:Uncharacterized protein n=1 Tax=Salvia splendens TaxID=180675 RepID=A0A8X8WA39_SALSN|nr:hypothetical protein SASPL_148342 [Salvia splendens]
MEMSFDTIVCDGSSESNGDESLESNPTYVGTVSDEIVIVERKSGIRTCHSSTGLIRDNDVNFTVSISWRAKSDGISLDMVNVCGEAPSVGISLGLPQKAYSSWNDKVDQIIELFEKHKRTDPWSCISWSFDSPQFAVEQFLHLHPRPSCIIGSLSSFKDKYRFSEESGFKEYAFFSVRKSSLIQFKTKLDMSMVANSKEDRCDFRIEGSWFERSCAIYARDTNNDIAQLRSRFKPTSSLI